MNWYIHIQKIHIFPIHTDFTDLTKLSIYFKNKEENTVLLVILFEKQFNALFLPATAEGSQWAVSNKHAAYECFSLNMIVDCGQFNHSSFLWCIMVFTHFL